MSKEFICKGCGEKFEKEFQSDTPDYCYICNEFYMRKQISDLEAKLEESEKKRKHLKDWLDNEILTSVDHETYYSTIDEYEKEIEQLKQQLAEKEKELKQLKLDLGMFKSVNEFLNSYGIEKAREVLLQTEKTKKQLKIEFAIAELEKVRDWCIGINENNKMYGFQKEPNLENCADIAQNRINDLKQQLTHQHEDKGD